MLDTCCEFVHEWLARRLSDNPSDGATLLRELEAEALLGSPIRAVSGHAGSLLIDYRLRIAPIPFVGARDFVRVHHQHCDPPVGWRFGAGCWNGPTLVGVIMVGRPVARMIDGATTVEVNRLCLDFSLPDPLRFNAVSKLLSYAVREARRRRFSRIITYTLQCESGHSLKAAGWMPTRTTRGGSWQRRGRTKYYTGPIGPKQRWERAL